MFEDRVARAISKPRRAHEPDIQALAKRVETLTASVAEAHRRAQSPRRRQEALSARRARRRGRWRRVRGRPAGRSPGPRAGGRRAARRDLRDRRAARAGRLPRRPRLQPRSTSTSACRPAASSPPRSPTASRRRDVPAVHRDDARRGASTRTIFLRPAFARVPAPRGCRCRRSLRARRCGRYLREPRPRGAARVVRRARPRAARPASSTTRSIDAFLARLFAAPGRTNDFRKLDAQALPRRDQPRHRRVGDFGAPGPRSRADLDARCRRARRCRGCSRRSRSTASTTSTARSTRRCTPRSRSTRASSCCCASIRSCRSTRAAPGAARRGAATG